MFVVMVLATKFMAGPYETLPGLPLIGVLPVYATREDAEKEWPGKPVKEIQEVKEG